MKHALSVSGLTCSYHGQAVLQDLSLAVNSGEIVCLLGASGCGKTTLLKAIAGLLPLEQGLMSINGRTIVDKQQWVPPEKRNIGMIFQDYALFPHLTVAQNIAFGLRHWDKARTDAKIQEMLTLVHLTGLEDRYPHQLSGGQQQRVAIARALACEPDLILLDEPFSNIDTQVRHSLIRDIRKIFKAQGVTAIFVTHSREEAFAFADKMAVMNHGVIEQFGSATELYYQPSSRFVADFLGTGSYLPATVKNQTRLLTPLGELALASNETLLDETSVDWLLRPQNLRVMLQNDGDGEIIEQQFMGDSCRYTVDFSGYKLIVNSNLLMNVGDRVAVEVEPHLPVVFAVA
ncbi:MULTISPECIES: ABC transporter ATP-binding protein [unclassified Photobacterium]|uniref:ABC transporter ATP-binding protein n=1 Tax=unclassified Photobacterium TaxID=2628852 RepID=UPI000D1610B7|nr:MULTISPECIES: ABC transporter ATP-binding protein [unclassified Photobacterium]PSV26599.1 ABC transporter [Photobacterium sp. GB-56]PSV31741.1 ABC transporter [Photobacterium sp. GB-72]PSV37497.1 ABC transporter [Photobacterium sp. GB-27]PSV39093.1 ABC transporter [Photobacterium sp. GB-210]PSV45436.1 ABC transporter [Photobacterium sp. GB-36]